MLATATNEWTETGADAFFAGNAFYVEERRGRLRSRNEFGIWDGSGQRVGSLVQRVSLAGHFWRIFLKSSVLPFRFQVTDRQGRPVAAIRRGWTLLVSRTEVVDSRNEVIGFLKHKYRSRKPRLKVFNAEGKKIGEVTGTQSSWDMAIIDRDYQSFGSIREFDPKNTPGDTRGKNTYFIELSSESMSPEERRVMLVTAISIDRLILENG
ncbi:MAG: hypothetical protein EOO12_08550 [Chitinophagaceae bacterium]|nr:MAG: hypothetical protein EOO12_08550 [Chitinophagaceae bacterium]